MLAEKAAKNIVLEHDKGLGGHMDKLEEIASGMVLNSSTGDGFDGVGMDIGDLQRMVDKESASGEDESEAEAASTGVATSVSKSQPSPPAKHQAGRETDNFCAWDQLIGSGKRALTVTIVKLEESVTEALNSGGENFDALLHLGEKRKEVVLEENAARLRDDILRMTTVLPETLQNKVGQIRGDSGTSPPTRTFLKLQTIAEVKASFDQMDGLRTKDLIIAKQKGIVEGMKPIRELIAAHRGSLASLSKAIALVRDGAQPKKKKKVTCESVSSSKTVPGSAWFEYAPPVWGQGAAHDLPGEVQLLGALHRERHQQGEALPGGRQVHGLCEFLHASLRQVFGADYQRQRQEAVRRQQRRPSGMPRRADAVHGGHELPRHLGQLGG